MNFNDNLRGKKNFLRFKLQDFQFQNKKKTKKYAFKTENQ